MMNTVKSLSTVLTLFGGTMSHAGNADAVASCGITTLDGEQVIVLEKRIETIPQTAASFAQVAEAFENTLSHDGLKIILGEISDGWISGFDITDGGWATSAGITVGM